MQIINETTRRVRITSTGKWIDKFADSDDDGEADESNAVPDPTHAMDEDSAGLLKEAGTFTEVKSFCVVHLLTYSRG